ncbi:MAG TPA: hypothetical protein VGD39_15355 [Nocardioides sp.]
MPLPPVSFPTLGWQVIDWMETYLCHGPGDVQGERWEIDDEIALFICWLYRVHPQDHPLAGRRLARRGILSRPKGRAKSEIAGGLMCAEGLGPVRCDGFDANGDPVGVPVTYPFIRCMATEEDQAGNTYDNVVYMLSEGEAANEYAFDIGRSAETSTRVILREETGGEIRPSSSGDASKDGGKESGATADETHLYISRQLRAMHRTVSRNTGKRKIAEPLMVETTTAYQPGENSIAEQAAERYAHLPIEECLTKHGVLYDHRQGSEPKRFGDNRSLTKALREGYGPAADWMDFPRIVQIIREAEDPEEEGYRYYLNIPRRTKEQWLAPAEIKTVLTEDVPETAAPVAAGFDGSDVDDHTALWVCTQDGLMVPVGIWVPTLDANWRQDANAAVDWLFENFKVPRFYGDPPWWQKEMGDWASKYSDPNRSGTLPVVEWWTNRDTPMAVACGQLRTDVRRQQVRINPTPLRTPPLFVANERISESGGGKPLAVWHFENARTRKVKVKFDDKAEEAYTVRKDRPGSKLKIDSVPAAVLARKACIDAIKEDEFDIDEPDYGIYQWD